MCVFVCVFECFSLLICKYIYAFYIHNLMNVGIYPVTEFPQLFVQFRGLLQGDEFVACCSLIVLYLYDNALTRIPLLDRNVSLSHLYLQNNKIEKIEGLDSLTSLTKL